MKKIKIASLVVTYFPTDENISNFTKLHKNTDLSYIVDNSNNKLIKEKLLKYKSKKVIVIFNKKNYGIGRSANFFFNKIKKIESIEWCILSDQDSIINKPLKKLFLNNPILKKTMIFGLNFQSSQIKAKNFISEVKKIIFSGMVLNRKVFELYRFREDFFLDRTDHEFCFNLKKNRIKIFKTNDKFMDHFVGSPTTKKLFFLKKDRTNHPPLNHFLDGRNSFKLIYIYGIIKFIKRQIKELSLTLLFDDEKKIKIKMRLLGIYTSVRKIEFKDIDNVKSYLGIED